ncbi:hypothetical protein SETIT_2G122400v2 [Setaria italica]|uniref:Uncharacterized protein n=1 Tax=Setaria italica TaxID=4555 RepID=A0A368PY83_SETIT|nr:hypothetical protein SETIT_2G122400v2 [Setaria italica]
MGKNQDEIFSWLEDSILALEHGFTDFLEQMERAGWDQNQIILKVPKEPVLPSNSSLTYTSEVMDPDITTISPVNKLHPQDDILATGSSRRKDQTEGQGICIWIGFRKKSNDKSDNSSDDDSDGDSGRKNKKAKKTRFTHTAKGKGKSKV